VGARIIPCVVQKRLPPRESNSGTSSLQQSHCRRFDKLKKSGNMNSVILVIHLSLFLSSD